MNLELLQVAKKSLKPTTFYIRESFIGLHEKFIPAENEKELHYETVNNPVKIGFRAVSLPEDNTTKFMYVVIYEFAVRGIFKEDVGEVNSLGDDASLENKIQLVITADFEATYVSAEKLDDNVLIEFAKYNTPHNLWPYWREYLQSSCLRIGMRHPIGLGFFNLELEPTKKSKIKKK